MSLTMEDKITIAERIQARIYAQTFYVPSHRAVLFLLNEFSEAKIYAAFDEYASHRSTAQACCTVNSFFDGGESRAVLTAIQMGLDLSQPKPAHVDESLQAAVKWLENFLSNGMKTETWISEHARHEADMSPAMLRRAKKQLGVTSKKQACGWMWALPSTLNEIEMTQEMKDAIQAATTPEEIRLAVMAGIEKQSRVNAAGGAPVPEDKDDLNQDTEMFELR
jgi:hypothetical protein